MPCRKRPSWDPGENETAALADPGALIRIRQAQILDFRLILAAWARIVWPIHHTRSPSLSVSLKDSQRLATRIANASPDCEKWITCKGSDDMTLSGLRPGLRPGLQQELGGRDGYLHALAHFSRRAQLHIATQSSSLKH